MYSEELRLKARKIAKELVWRLEILQHRTRYSQKTGLKMLPTRIKRFSTGLPQDMVALVLEELVAMAPYSGVIYNGNDEGDEIEYRPTTTYVKRDQTLGDPGRHRADHTYTIVQDLLLADEADTFGSIESSSCSRTVKATRHWDEPDLPDCPTGQQGVSYQITDVSRDKETDLFSYTLREVVALTQHVPAHVTECTEDFVRTIETWDNVYGEPGNYRFNNSEEGEPGDAITLPAVCKDTTGETVQVSVTENEDCTFKLQVVATISKRQTDAEFNIYHDQFVIRSASTNKNEPRPLDRTGVDYGGGKKTTYESKLNSDGTFDNRVATEVERSVRDAVVETRKTLRGVVVSTTHRNQQFAASVTGLKIGASVRNEKTEGGLYNQVIVTPSQQNVGNIRRSCSKTLFLHDHSVLKNVVKEEPVDVQDATGGVVLTRQVSLTEEGTYDITDDVRTELPVTDASVEKRRTLRGLITTVTHRNQKDPAALPAGIGSSVRNDRTDGGLYNQVLTSVEQTVAGMIRGTCQQNLFWHEHSTTNNQMSNPGAERRFPGGGVTTQRQVVATDEGTFDVTDSERTENSVSDAVVEQRKTLRGLITTRTHRSQRTPAPSPTKLGEQVRNAKTEGGLYDQTIVQVAATDAGTVASSCAKTAFEHQQSTVVNQATRPSEHTEEASGGRTRQRRINATDEGTFDVTDVVTEELEQRNAVVEKQRTTHGLVTTTTHKAVRAVSDPKLGIGDSFTSSLTPGKVHDTVHRKVEITDNDFRTWVAEVDLNRYYCYTKWFENATEEQYQQIIKEVEGRAKQKTNHWDSVDRAPGSVHVSPEVRHTEVDRYDGHVTFVATWSSAAAGQTGVKDKIFANHTAHNTETVNDVYDIESINETTHKKEVVHCVKTTKVQHFTISAHGRGYRYLNQYLQQVPAPLGTVSDSFSIDPVTLNWSFNRSIKSDPDIQITKSQS